jgi:hypothetical protein
MGGQAYVFYGAAEFSRDVDLVIVADSENLDRLRAALGELKATRIFVPELTEEFLRRGHAVHFRCTIPEANRIRVGCHVDLARRGSVRSTLATPNNNRRSRRQRL